MSKMPIARSKVSTTTSTSTTSRNMTSHQIVSNSITNSSSFRDSFEEYSTKSPSRMLFLKDSALKMSPGWVSGHANLFESPKTPLPKAVETYKSSVYTKKTSTSSTSVDVFKKPGAVFISPTGVKTRARRSSIYQKSGKNLLAGLTGKSRRDSLAAVRSKRLVSESDYAFSVPKTDTSGRRKLVSKKNKTASAKKPSIIRSPSPKKNTTNSKSPTKTKSKLKSNSPLKISSLKVKLAIAEPSKKTTRKIPSNVAKPTKIKSKSSPFRPPTKDVTVTITTSSMKRALPEKSPTKQSSSKKSKIVKSSPSEVNLMDDDDEEDVTEEETVFSPRRTRKTPGKKMKRSLSSVNKGAKKRMRSPSKSPLPARKKSTSVKSKYPASSKKRKITKSPSTKNKNSISSRKSSLEVSLVPFEAESFTNLKISDSDKKKLATPSKKSTKTTSKRRISMKTSTSSSLSTPLHDSSPKMTPTSNKTPSIKTHTSSPKTPKTTKPKSSAKKNISTPKSSRKTPLRRSLQSSRFDLKASDELSTVTKSIDDVQPVSTTDVLPKSKTPLSTIKMKSILDSVTSLTNAEDKKRKTRDLAVPHFDQDRFEQIVASTPRDMRLDILSGRRPELSPITNSVNKSINNSMKQITIFSDKSTFLSTGPSNLSPVAAHSPLRFNVSDSRTEHDEIHGRTDDDEDDVFDYSNISCSSNPVMSKPYLFDYDTELDTSHSNIRSGCTIL